MYKGRRITLRAPKESDAAILQGWYLDKDFRHLYDAYNDVSLTGIMQDIQNSGSLKDPHATKINFVICRKRDELPIGVACIRNISRQHGNAEIVFAIGDRDKRLAGYGVDLLIVLLDLVFYELGFEKCYIKLHKNNALALNSALNFGFVQEGCLRRHEFLEGMYLDLVILGLLKEDYEKLPIVPKWKARNIL
ncbi:Protein N-acetyltransferase, RimJ/RimL family [Desulfonispora thiosulfatigenes DSM 11270]|uniref:Protein N-acetyltransferase, RimJ/RimL family n=1 Tax=Desulfonispora thiosulfatigenes DSM 11270 TaxID=656914 RepID=A0A1W1V1C6_DESTI|nr:GNAT family protein [Desulfonispora thiosulfatigenes]SMB86801.1 Protein N-acetyltransferase, RimJ/RimL family [Desulfonispora thiosulfatigenes DSM 11270]